MLFSGYSGSATNKTYLHNIAEILLKVALSTINQTKSIGKRNCSNICTYIRILEKNIYKIKVMNMCLPRYLYQMLWTCLSFDLRILITLVSDYLSGSFGYVGVCPSIYGFWLHLCLIILLVNLTMLVSVLRFTDSDYTCVWLSLWFFWLCWCLSFDLRILITLVSDYLSGSIYVLS